MTDRFHREPPGIFAPGPSLQTLDMVQLPDTEYGAAPTDSFWVSKEQKSYQE